MADIFDSIRGVGEASRQRVKRSEALLSQLYRDEVDPPFRVPKIRGLGMMAAISVIAVVFFTGTLFYKFNSFIWLREDVLTKGGNLESAVQRRKNLFGNLINLTLNHASLEHSVFSTTAKMRTEIIKKSKLPEKLAEKLAAAGKGAGGKGDEPLAGDWTKALESLFSGGDMDASLGRLLAVVERYPNIQSSKTYLQMMSSLVEMEDLIATRRVEYNLTLREYNTAISKFPWRLLAEVTSFERFEYYTIATEGTAAPIITPAMYKQLFPLKVDAKEAGK
ncbi:MAG: magnetosome protein MamQ [Rhodospirillales bacterium]